MGVIAMGGCPKGYSPAEAALYRAADHAQPGAAVELALSPDERLDIRMIAPHGRRTAQEFRAATLQVNLDEDGITASPARECHLKVGLRQTAFAACEAGRLSLDLPPEVALVIIPADGRLGHGRPEPKELMIECSRLVPPLRPHRSPASAANAPSPERP
jgi:hypothetical protein